jgi:phage baseplate assembly protein W
MDHGFLGSGVVFPIRLDTGHGGVRQTASGEEAVRQSIWMILGTAPGERVMRPDFGCGIHDAVFAVHDTDAGAVISAAVREALTRWEPRIDVLDVYAVPDAGDPHRLLIEINYQVRSTNSRFNLVYPFYLS